MNPSDFFVFRFSSDNSCSSISSNVNAQLGLIRNGYFLQTEKLNQSLLFLREMVRWVFF